MIDDELANKKKKLLFYFDESSFQTFILVFARAIELEIASADAAKSESPK